MKNIEVQNIKRLMTNTFDGSAWYGPSVLKTLEDVNAALAFKKFENIHTIAELVKHMATWKTFALKRILGDHEFDIGEVNDWTKFDNADEQTWIQIKNELIDVHTGLVHSLEKVNDSRLSELVADKAYDYYTLLHGVIQHDIYHTGQISLLKKQ